ncbi:olfactory receptor 5B12-like [Macrotis lagotis]|uniref:olfactory receptor 5B12-like n=1 Tax=Macrotis lagotis TaxID=92651 RepID=UPI003D68312F
MTSLKNRSEVNEFIFTGVTDDQELQVPLFIMFTLIYLITLVGNLGIIVLICWDSCLHTPMYFLLSNLSLVDFGYSSAVTPLVMAGLIKGKMTISFKGCAAQLFFFGFFSASETLLLASMAYDRYAAICKPLHYSTIMTPTLCTHLVSGAYVCGFLTSFTLTVKTFSLSFCRSNIIHHFFCDMPPLLIISCSDIHITETMLIILGSLVVLFPFLVILASYLLIFNTVLKIRSSEGRQKAFSTCASHLTAVAIYYGSVIFMYFLPSAKHSMDTDKVVSVFYTMFIPMLNPLVYSLRNKDVKNAFRKAVRGKPH